MKGYSFVFLAISLLTVVSCDTSRKPSPASQPAPDAPNSSSTNPPTTTPQENWNYTNDVDEMTGKKREWACTQDADEGAELCLRKRNGQLESYVHFDNVSDGQFLCDEDDCTMKARFDDDPAITFGGVEAAGGDTTMLFIEPTSKLVAHLHKARSLKLQPPIFEKSGEVLHFEFSGLKW